MSAGNAANGEHARRASLITAPSKVPSTSTPNPRRSAALLTVAAFTAVVLDGYVLLAPGAASAETRSRHVQATSVAADAAAILALRGRPNGTSAAGLSSTDLLLHVSAAMAQAGMKERALVSVLPLQPRRIAGSDQVEVGHRLLLEDVTTREFGLFCTHLCADPARLQIVGIHVRADAVSGAWNTDVVVRAFAAQPTRAPR